jgi:alkanesulfonate monooxygenase SsuD/methylene tetrahydromethanopterin reductase-like flavin-dependent oxidoreductase (luciferase family)
VFLELLKGEGFAKPNPRPMFPNPPGLLPIEPHTPGLRERIWWGAASPTTAAWAAAMGMNLMSSTLVFDDASGDPFHLIQARHIHAFREAWREAGHERDSRVSVSRSIFALVSDMDRAYFGNATKAVTTSVTSTRTRGRSSAAPTQRSPTSSSHNSPRTRRSRPPTRSC